MRRIRPGQKDKDSAHTQKKRRFGSLLRLVAPGTTLRGKADAETQEAREERGGIGPLRPENGGKKTRDICEKKKKKLAHLVKSLPGGGVEKPVCTA